jgi:excisionase family DNA binding protein
MSLREFLSVAQPTSVTDDPDRHLSRVEAAELLGVPPKTVENLAREQRLPSVLVGRRRVYRRSALLARMLEAERTGLGI